MVKVANGDGAATAASAPTAVVQATPPSGITPPTISGIAQRGSTLTSAAGTWGGIGNTYAYQWQRDRGQGFLSIAGATASTYPLDVTDEGTAVRLLITATNPDGAVSVASPASAVVKAAGAVNTSGPSITGTAQRGNTLSGSQGSWSGIGNVYAIQWQESTDGVAWADIIGATESSYTPSVADEGMKLRLSVSATNPDGTATAVSQPTAAVLASAPANAAAPTIAGTPQRGATLTSTAGAWSGLGTTFSFQWQRSSTAGAWIDISGANAASYTVAVADEGANLRLAITASNPDGSVTVASQSTAIAPSDPPVARSLPTVAGTAQRSFTLTATGAWNGVGNTYAYQWQHDSGHGFVDIADATSLHLPARCRRRGHEAADDRDRHQPGRDRNRGQRIDSDRTRGAAGQHSCADDHGHRSAQLRAQRRSRGRGGLGNTYAYQWQRSTDGSSWSDIDGATTTSYTLGRR